jgi:hypothetical protein
MDKIQVINLSILHATFYCQLTLSAKRPAKICGLPQKSTQTTARFPVRLSLDPDFVGEADLRLTFYRLNVLNIRHSPPEK